MSEGYKLTDFGEFPEGWEVVKLESVGRIISGGTPDTKTDSYWGGGVSWCTPTDITALKGRKYISRTERTISEEGVRNSSATLLPPGSLVVCTRATIGACAVNQVAITTNQGFKSIVPNENSDVNFLYYFIRTIKSEMVKLSSGSTFLEISKKAFENIRIPLPPLPEQQEIASILSTVDEKIAIIDEQISQTQELKKGLMQQLLTKGIGHTKFKSSALGDVPDSWEVVKQKDVATFYNGRAYKLSEWEETGTPVIRLQNLTRSGRDFYYSNLKLPEHQYCNEGDLLYMWSATFGPVFWQGSKAIFHYHIWKIEERKERLNKRFHFYLLDDATVRMKSQSHGSTMLHVTKAGMENLLIKLPPLKEQERIVAVLSSIDEKLNSLQSRNKTYLQLKKGLMQQLLTGKIRVNTSQNEPALA